jgi:two-component system chemotaxis response regulator CheY
MCATCEADLQRAPEHDVLSTKMSLALAYRYAGVAPFEVVMGRGSRVPHRTQRNTALSSRVLVVEDSASMRAFVRATLEDAEGMLVTEASSGFDALRILPREQFDLVVVDINMPDINGLELISFMRTNPSYERVPLLIISTEASSRDRERGLALGANGYLAKPFTPEQLMAAVRALGTGLGEV